MVVSSLKGIITSALSGVQAMAGNLFANKEYTKLNDFFDFLEWVYHSFVVWIYTVTGILIIPFVLIYTKSVSDAEYNSPLFAILITVAFAGFTIPIIYKIMIKAAGHYRQTQTASVIEAILNVVFSVVLVFKFGLVGVAIGTIISMLYRLIYHVWYLKHNIMYRSYKPFIKQTAVDIITVMAIVWATKFVSVNSSNYLGWILSAIIISCISILILLLINFIFYRNKFYKLIKTIKLKIRKVNN